MMAFTRFPECSRGVWGWVCRVVGCVGDEFPRGLSTSFCCGREMCCGGCVCSTAFSWELTTPAHGAAFEVSNSVLEVAAGPDGLVLNNYFPRGIPEFVKDGFSNNAEIIELFTELFGPFPHDSFGMTFLDMTLPFAGYASPHRAYVLFLDEQLLAHEIAHSWFGSSVPGASSSDNWLVEGFTTYAESLWLEHTGGAEAYDREARSLKFKTGARTRPLAIVKSVAELIDPVAYQRGGLVFHGLRLELGDDVFFELLKVYVDRFTHDVASTADFIAVAEEVSQRDLSEFFDGWLFSEWVPQLAG